MSYIRLDSELGVNPTLTYCPICGNEAEELLLVGAQTEYRCRNGHRNIGRPEGSYECGVKGCGAPMDRVGKFDGSHEPLPASQPCDRCREVLSRTNLLICPQCRKMFEADAHQVLKLGEFAADGTGDFSSLAEGIERGYLVPVVGKVVRPKCPDCPEEG